MLDMAPTLVPRVIDGGEANRDALGYTYVALAIIYTVLVSAELYLLYLRRSAFCIQIRNLRVVFAAVSILHIYLILVLLVYPWNGLFPCSAEFWIMSLFLPCGMAFFQACNARVLKAYESQRRLQVNFLEGARKKRVVATPRGLYEAWFDLDATSKVYVGSLLGLILSLIPSTILFLGSRRFHPKFGFFGPGNVDFIECRRGPEWIPSILVQLFWTAIVGPWILWKIRKVSDVHSWAWQTRLAIIAGLPGTPLWMAFTYSKIPAMLSINKYFPPAGWFLSSLLVCQQVLIIIPLLDALNSPSRRTSISSFHTSTTTSTLTSVSTTSSTSSSFSSHNKKSPRIILTKELKPKASMQALEFSIENALEPLIAWTATREFTAENTIFLREVRNFRRKWGALELVTTSQRRQMFNEASLIFFTLVNPFTAETPINIEYKIFRALQNTFSNVEYDPYMPSSSSSSSNSSASNKKTTPRKSSEKSNNPGPHPPSPTITNANAAPRDNVVCPWEDVLERPTSFDSQGTESSTSSARSIVPSEFTEEVFDAAFESIKYLVFTNTWPRYVEAELSKGPEMSP